MDVPHPYFAAALLVTAGVLIATQSLTPRACTEIACPDGETTSQQITGIDLTTVHWSDGCNTCTSSALPLHAGILLALTGIVTGVHALRQTHSAVTETRAQHDT